MTDRVLFVSTQMEAAGVQVISSAMQRALLREGVPTELAFLYRKRPAFAEDESLYALLGRPPGGIADYFAILRRLWSVMRTRRPTAVVGFSHYSSPIACAFGAANGVERRVATQTNPPQTVPIMARLVDLVCGMTGIYTHNIAASETVLEAFARYPRSYRKRLLVVRNGIEANPSSLTQQQARAHFGLPQGVPLIVSCGRLSPQKNHLLLLSAMRNLPDCHLAIAGEGELRQELEHAADALDIASRVTLLGEIAPAEVKDFLRCGDVFAFPSQYEAFGLAVAEAMMSGLPVVASDHAALREVVGEAGILLPIKDPAPWAREIRTLLADHDRRTRMAEQSRKRGALFSFDSMLQGFKSVVLQHHTRTGTSP